MLTCEWEDLGRQGWHGSFDAVFCVGNSLTHAAGKTYRCAALQAMAAVLRERGLLVLTSRNWERVRAEGSVLRVADRLVELPRHRTAPCPRLDDGAAAPG